MMKPCGRKVFDGGNLLQGALIGMKSDASIRGSTKKLGKKYKNALVVLFSKANLSPLAVRKPDANCEYQFAGINTDLKTFIVAFDQNQQYNAVIQDNVVPK